MTQKRYKRAILSAIKIALLDADNFTVSSDSFESKLENTKHGNTEVRKVTRALEKTGITVYLRRTSYGKIFGSLGNESRKAALVRDNRD